MAASKHTVAEGAEDGRENIRYIVQMLGELHRLADTQRYDMLCYLLEMAYLEANELQLGNRP